MMPLKLIKMYSVEIQNETEKLLSNPGAIVSRDGDFIEAGFDKFPYVSVIFKDPHNVVGSKINLSNRCFNDIN